MHEDLVRLTESLGDTVSPGSTSALLHDLKGPLNAISGFAALLKEQTFGPLNEKQLKFLRNIEESADSMLARLQQASAARHEGVRIPSLK